MKQILLLAGAVALGFAGPAISKPGNGNGHGNGHGNAYGKGHGNVHGYGVKGTTGYGVGGCPPGLRNKGCVPPGQAKKMFNVGQRFSTNYGTRYSYRQIPYDIRNQYDLNPRYRYYYGNGYLYQVDPRTLLVQQAIATLLR